MNHHHNIIQCNSILYISLHIYLCHFISLSLYKTTIYKITGHHVRLYLWWRSKIPLTSWQSTVKAAYINAISNKEDVCLESSISIDVSFLFFLNASAQRIPPPLFLPCHSLIHTNTWITQSMTAPPTSRKAFTCWARVHTPSNQWEESMTHKLGQSQVDIWVVRAC